MLGKKENAILTQTGPNTPMGDLFRHYWMPALLSEELSEIDGAPVKITVLGEALLAFRDSNGEVGIVDRRCPHRGADLFFGRNEDCGLRCVYHGWKFDVRGNCVELPTAPENSRFKEKIKLKVYPAKKLRASSGVLWDQKHQNYPIYLSKNSLFCQRSISFFQKNGRNAIGRNL